MTWAKMRDARPWGPIAFSGGLFLLVGCGGSAPTSNAPPGNRASLLAGNWQLTASLPVLEIPISLAPGFSLAVTIGGSGDKLIATSALQLACASGGEGGSGGGLSGSIAQDGSFTLSTPANSNHPEASSLVIQGTLPKVVGGAWAGTYTYNNPGSICGQNVTGPIDAQKLPTLMGSYTGTTYLTGDIERSRPITFNLQLAQTAATGVLDPTGLPIDSALTGAVALSGPTCFSSGATRGSTVGVFGSDFNAVLDMNDGSTSIVRGSVLSPDESTLQLAVLPAFKAGTCTDRFQPFTLRRVGI